jgi:hypothetical protein
MRALRADKAPTRLAFGRAHDPLEQQAERFANQVMHMPDSQSVQTELLERVGDPWSTSKAIYAPRIVQEVLRSPGQTLDPASRAFFEPRFGCDFSQIRVHADEKAARSAHSIGAAAYTVGRAIVFGRDAFRPRNQTGRRLIAHELTHVVQQARNDAAGAFRDTRRENMRNSARLGNT